jgi:hypothetical protein
LPVHESSDTIEKEVRVEENTRKEKRLRNGRIKPYEELTFADDFMFKRVMMHEDICRQVLERILGKRIRTIRFHETEKSMKNSPPGKGVRLDVYLWNDDTAYDIEMQTSAMGAIGLRARYYQSAMDMDSLESGKSYEELKEGVVIFICLKAPFDRRLARYTFRETCQEVADLDTKIGTSKIFLFAGGNMDHESMEMKQFLDYVRNHVVPAGDALIRKIDDTVVFERQDTRGKEAYRMFSLALEDAKKEAKEEERADNVSYLMKKHGMTFEEATAFLGIQGEDKENCRAVIEEQEKQPETV